MTALDELRASVRVLMFDQYGTVVDIQGGLVKAATPYLRSKGWQGRADALVTWWRRAHFENSMIDALLHREHTAYRDIGQMSLDYTLERAGIAHTDDEVKQLVAEIEKLTPFAEVPAALDKLRKRYTLAVLSNGDADMLEAARPYHGIAFDHLISVAIAGAFKPHAAAYAAAADVVGTPPDAILFVASHAFDCVGAKAAGMRSCFINRRRRPFGKWLYQPDLIVADFTELAHKLG